MRAGTRRSLTARVVGATALACVLLAGVEGWHAWERRGAVLEEHRVASANLARSLAQHAHDLVQTADTAALALREEVEIEGLGARTVPRLERVVRDEVASVPVLHGLFVFDASGAYTVASAGMAAGVTLGTGPRPNGSDRPYFQYHRTHPDRDARVEGPMRSKVDGQWILTVSRRIDGPDGGFAGVAVATIAVTGIQDLYASFDVGPHGAVALETDGSVLVARKPAEDARIGADLSHGSLAAHLPPGRTGAFEYASAVDGTQRLGSAQHVAAYPLFVVVAYGRDDVLAPWWAATLLHLGTSLALATALALLGWRLVALVRVRQGEARRVEDSERHYRLLATYSTDVISQLGPDLRRVYVSPSCEAMLGYDPRELVGRHCTDMLSPEDQAVFASSLAIAQEEGQAPPATYRVRRKDGREIWVETIGRRMPDGQGFVMATREVTDRLRAEARLRDTAARLRELGAEGRVVA